MKEDNKKGLIIDEWDAPMFDAALEAWDFALLHQKGLSTSSPDVIDYIIEKSNEIRALHAKYFPKPKPNVFESNARTASNL